MPRTKSSNIARRTSPSAKKTERKKREASETRESQLSGSPKPEDTSDRQVPVTRTTNSVGRPFRMKLLPTARVNPNRYKDYSPEPAGRSVSVGEPVAGGSGLSKRSSRACRIQSGTGKRGRFLESPDRSVRSKRFAGHSKVRKFEKMRNYRHQKRATAAKKDETSSSSEISSVNSAELVSSGGNNADSSSSEQEQPKRAKGVKL